MPSRVVCFVCGSLGGEYPLHSRRRESGAYFPFLEHHEPPKGSRIPGQDGIVDSCHVCCAFLTQQWETYEQTNTPAIKRLYWLKRLDDGPFTGAEMKLQGEYMAQVMGLQYQPSCGDTCSVPLSPDENKVSRSDAYSSGSGVKRDKKSLKDYGGDVGVLDLSVPVVKQECPSKRPEKRGHQDEMKEDKHPVSKFPRVKPSLDEYSFICYTCGAEMQGVAAKVISSSRRADNEPFFPFLGKITPPKGAQPINSQGMCKVCENCFSPLCHQWFSYENNGTPNTARIFKIKDSFFSNDSSIVIGSGKDAQSGVLEVCYLCSRSWPSLKMCPLYTVPDLTYEHSMYFPFVRELRRPQGARPLNPDGSVRVCIGCFGNLQLQWQRFELEKVPFLQRRYSLLPTSSSLPSSSSNPSESSATPSSHPLDNAAYPKSSVTMPLKIEVGESKSPVPSGRLNTNPLQQGGGQPLPPNHPTAASVPSAANTHPNVELLRQQSNECKTASSSNVTANTVPHPLLQAGERPKKVCFVCGEKVLVSKAQILCSHPIKPEAKMMGGQQMSVPFFPFLTNREHPPGSDPMTEEGTVITCSYCFYSLINQWREFEESKAEADKNRWLRKYVTCEFVCFICGLTVTRKKIRTLEVQKFPFLRDHKAPHNALVMWAGEGVAACGSCHFSLTHQYSEYERLGVPMEMRKYNWTVRDNSNDDQDINHPLHYSGNEDSNLSLDDAPLGLPPGATSSIKPLSLGSLSSGSAAASASALAAAGGGKLPPKTAAVPPMNQQQQMSPSNGLTNSSSAATAAAVAAAAAAANRSTSSFAAALRKLANQAQDPLEESHSLKPTSGSSPPSSAHSPRATTPKRSHIHPMAFPAHSAPSSLPAPPVVTIAPTPAHPLHNHHSHHSSSQSSSHHSQHHHHQQQQQHSHLLSSGDNGRQTSDRLSSAQSASSSYDHLGKTPSSSDRDQRPLSTHSRDDDRSSGKDNSLSRAPSRAHPQGSAPTPTSTASSSGLPSGLPLTPQGLDLYARTFHPYHPDEEAALRQSLALSAYGIDPATYAAAVAASAAYHPALVQHPAFSPGGFRLDDPLLLERYRLLQSPYFPFPPAAASGILPPHPATPSPAAAGLAGMHPMLAAAAAASANQRYPADLLQQHYAAYLGSQNHPLMDPRLMAQAALLERSRLEEEKLREEREKERAKELERERDREREKREKERAAERELAYRAERERERLSSEHQLHHHRGRQHEVAERRDILTVPTRLPVASDRERESRDRDGRDHHRSSSQQHHHHHHSTSSHDLVDAHMKRSSGLSNPNGLPSNDSRNSGSAHNFLQHPSSQHHKDMTPTTTTTSTAFNIYNSLHPFKNHPLGKPPELRPSSHEHSTSKPLSGTTPSSSSSSQSSRHSHHNISSTNNANHHHQSKISDLPTPSSKSEITNPFSPFYHAGTHTLHQQLLDQWSHPSSTASKLVSAYPPPPLIPNQPKEKIRKSSESSGIFRPFDEPKTKSDDENNHHYSKLSSSSSSPKLQQHKNSSLHHQGNLTPSSTIHEKSNSSHFSNPFMRKDEKSSSASSEVLSIPVLRVPPQSHMMSSDLQARTNHQTSHSTASVDTIVKNRSSSILSNNVQNRIERFDFKSLARECTSTTSSGSPPPLVQQQQQHQQPPAPLSSSFSTTAATSSVMTQQPLFTNPYKSFYSNSHHHILESAPFSLPALMESAFHEDLLLRQRKSLSKLDVEEKRMKELGRGTEDSDGELDEVEEKMTARLTMIGRLTPLPLETSEDKMNFLETVGLTTHDKKKELQIKKEMRRRRLQRLASVSPVLFQSDEPVLDGTSHKDSSKGITPALLTRLMQASRSGGKVDELLLNEMDSEEKAQFFKQLGMLPQSHAEKSDIEMKRLCAEFINAKYNGMQQENCLKRKHEDVQNIHSATNKRLQHEPSKKLSNLIQPLTSSSSLLSSLKEKDSSKSDSFPTGKKAHSRETPMSKNKAVPSMDTQATTIPPTSKSDHSVSTVTSSTTSSSLSSMSSTKTSTPASSSRPDSSSAPSSVIFPPHPLVNSSALHSSFAEEFHKSVLQESFNYHQKQQQQLLAKQHSADIRDNRASEIHHRPSSSPQPPPLPTPASSNSTKPQHYQRSAHLNNHHPQNSSTSGSSIGSSSSNSSITGALSSKPLTSSATNNDVGKCHNPTTNAESLLKSSTVGGQPSQPSHPSPQLLSQAALAGLYPWPGGLNAMMESYQRQHGGASSSSSVTALHNGESQANSDLRRN